MEGREGLGGGVDEGLGQDHSDGLGGVQGIVPVSQIEIGLRRIHTVISQ